MKKKCLLFSGKMSSGKNQLAEYVSQIYTKRGLNVASDMFAGSLKQWASQDFKLLMGVLNDMGQQIRNEADKINKNRQSYGLPHDGVIQDLVNLVNNSLVLNEENFFEKKTPISRALLQIYGTEIFRNRVDDMYWVKLTQKRIIASEADVVIITDVRFPNEIDFIANSNKYETYSIRINRLMNRDNMLHEHDSEKALDHYQEFSYLVDNNEGLDELRDSAVGIIEDIEALE